ncbi:PEP-CTERM sorting domain-containing protein [Tautonia sociabilis]|uniref:PEP-CTERM sorting domain-containing protein n=1 Tax=Tautonia sociabilis TaxID=2080755 RepID=A0A432MN27_9BACT|nr:PEP-CTERM sorting domain-containing protein [Tautonia sociabilis]RUL88822.1 PEP-CTERM sorting domain-containing protein [Tautonia sociabilis]
MHRMRHYVAVIGLIAGATALSGSPARANLIRNDPKLAFPDVLAAAINGRIEYDYDEASQRGVLTVTNTPWEIAGSETSSFPIDNPDGANKSQFLRVVLDSSGNVIDDPLNFYELKGKIEANGQTFEGILLTGTPTNFGWLDLGGTSMPQLGLDTFDAEIAITGGELAKFYGDSAYMEFTPLIESTFEGSFANDFTGLKPVSNIRSYNSPEPFPIPEPTTLVVLLGGGAALLYRRHRRRPAA